MATDRQYVLVLGAGASWDYGLPIGAALLGNIQDMCLEDPSRFGEGRAFAQLVNRHFGLSQQSPNPASLTRDLGHLIQGQIPPSIDRFLGQPLGPEFLRVPEIGKLAVAWIIAKSERSEQPDGEPAVRYEAVQANGPQLLGNPWYRAFWQSLGIRQIEDIEALIERQSLRVVNFNYDRGFDQFVLNRIRALCRARGRGEKDATEIFSRFPIAHPYGSLGSVLELQYGSYYEPLRAAVKGRDLATLTEPLLDALVRMAASLRVVEEQRVEELEDAFGEARDWMTAADVLVFLGFGFDPTNVTRLGFPACAKSAGSVYATSYELGMALRQRVRLDLLRHWDMHSVDSMCHIQDAHQKWPIAEYLAHYQPFKDLALR